MNWWGKTLGGTFGFLLGGPLGGLLGTALGHQIDNGLKKIASLGLSSEERKQVQSVFFTTTFSVMGHLAKADGWVSPNEIRMAEIIMTRMKLSPERRRVAIGLFNQGKQPDFPLNEVLDQFYRNCRYQRVLVRVFLQIQLQAAMADGPINRAKQHLLWHIFARLGISQREFKVLLSLLQGKWEQKATGRGETQQRRHLKRAYTILEINESASNAEVKHAYRRLMSQHHPDKLAAKGLPEDLMTLATEKAKTIGAAYEQIRKIRGF
ncbi:Heat shock protein DnaJ-like protein [Nitrosococcus oceani ATCC 19707]|uniref:Co-chaperone protein DjlA n=2 Tax=Nitrosococcus oceani TaxID=1229 RepID=Q3J6W5_NITOC|nr:co-chaperone DjlA [Nitrosococcus oceani]ABA59431.1 Heat shock protein DnaJ-like protein [Nitrosococcus oceani ATCC 19707]EDZ65886.1 DnaJ domain protein [Nitrosococcus oceani AFC27]KFI18174.1 molecular chaperone DnaJ [Nitrosococcus oceani C-27]GEM19998.1 molecular chaperone DjlA [Nitrosococcus oceani]